MTLLGAKRTLQIIQSARHDSWLTKRLFYKNKGAAPFQLELWYIGQTSLLT